MTEWYSPRQIRFTRDQVEWLIQNLNTLEEGNWPVMPPGYTDNEPSVSTPQPENVSTPQPKNGTHKVYGHMPAYFETPAEIASEISWRIDRCGKEGQMLKDRCLYGKDDRDMELTYGMRIEEIDDCIHRVMRYIVGWKRKGSYRFWKWRQHGYN